MSSTTEQKCPECGGVIPEGSPHCPACMLGNAMGNEDSLRDVSGDTTSSIDLGPVTEGVGDTIGSYSLLEKLGEGGFGVVWAAEQKQPVKRRVALKIIKLGMDTKQVVARFEAERQALAMMDHPNIAKVLDAGSTETGRPYFVMELVKGVPVTQYFEQERTEVTERLKLFVLVCQAIQHAHQKGIIHRDIKPSNILITLHDGVPVPKVIDFGIAKATQGELTDKTIYTQYSQFIGTPAYMSPEQAELSGLDIDTRTDVYSLGVLLYEILTGTTPFDGHELARSGLDAMRRIIREREPEKPSTRMSQTLAQGDVKRSRVLTAETVSRVRGDLDWIVMKCLEKDRTRRYETATGLARDVERHLNDEPVTAVAPSLVYLIYKLARRNKPLAASIAIVLPTVVIAGLLSIWMLSKEREANRRLVSEEAKTRQASEALEKQLQQEQLNTYVGDIRAAHDFLKRNRLSEAKQLLDRYDPASGAEEDLTKLREFSWYYLTDEIIGRSDFIPMDAHRRTPEGIVFSPDGRLLVSASAAGEVFVWNVATKRLVTRLEVSDAEGLDGSFWYRPRFSTDGRYLIVRENLKIFDLNDLGQRDLEVRIWEITNERFRPIQSRSINGYRVGSRWNLARAAIFVPDSHQLLLCQRPDGDAEQEYHVVIDDLASGATAVALPNAGTIQDLSPSGELLLTLRWFEPEPELVVWDLAARQELAAIPARKDTVANFLDDDWILVGQYHPDGSDLPAKQRMAVFDARTLLPGPKWAARTDFTRLIKRAQGAATNLYLGRESELLDPASGSHLQLDSITGGGEDIALNHDGTLCAVVESVGLNNSRVRFIETRRQAYSGLQGIGGWAWGSFFADGKKAWFRFAGEDRSWAYRLPEMDAGRPASVEGTVVTTTESGELWVRTMDSAPAGGCTVKRFNEKGELIGATDLDYPLTGIYLLRSGKVLFVKHYAPPRIEVRDPESFDVLARYEGDTGEILGAPKSALAVESDILALYRFRAGGEGRIEFLRGETLEVLGTSGSLTEASVSGVVFSSKRNQFLVYCENGEVVETSLPDLKRESSFQLAGGRPTTAAISSDGRTLAVGSWGFSDVNLYCADTKKLLMTLSNPVTLTGKVGFSPRGDVLFMVSSFLLQDQSLMWWSAPRPE